MIPLPIPVLDLRGGVVVHAVAGQRSEYRPLKSLLTNSTEPVEVLQQLRAATGLETFYVADLDGIIDGRPDWKVLQRLTDTGVRLLIDAGVRQVGDIDAVRLGRNVRPVVGTESFVELDRLLSGTSADVVCSLDLHAGRLRMADQGPETGQITVELLAERLWTAGLRSWIVLDIAAVGTGQGIPTLPLCRTLNSRFPGVELISGGGVRTQECLLAAGEAGVTGVLVASALHTGALGSVLRA